jgi:uncharacterized membrane protein
MPEKSLKVLHSMKKVINEWAFFLMNASLTMAVAGTGILIFAGLNQSTKMLEWCMSFIVVTVVFLLIYFFTIEESNEKKNIK